MLFHHGIRITTASKGIWNQIKRYVAMESHEICDRMPSERSEHGTTQRPSEHDHVALGGGGGRGEFVFEGMCGLGASYF